MSTQLYVGRRTVGVVLLAIATAAASLGAHQASAPKEEGVLIHNGFGTGKSFLDDMSSAQRRAYAMGAINGMLVSPMFGASKEELQWLEQCVENMTDDQVAAIIARHLRDHPERWHHGLHVESWAAMKDACRGE
jgi:hypothetical protein